MAFLDESGLTRLMNKIKTFIDTKLNGALFESDESTTTDVEPRDADTLGGRYTAEDIDVIDTKIADTQLTRMIECVSIAVNNLSFVYVDVSRVIPSGYVLSHYHIIATLNRNLGFTTIAFAAKHDDTTVLIGFTGNVNTTIQISLLVSLIKQ